MVHEREFVAVCDTAKVRFFKQITTSPVVLAKREALFAILQKYDSSSKSQPHCTFPSKEPRCLRYCKSTIFQANHNSTRWRAMPTAVVCDTAKVRFFKQITTYNGTELSDYMLFAILQKYDFSSKSQLRNHLQTRPTSCLRYCKSTIFQANHNRVEVAYIASKVVCDTAKVRFFKQITTWYVVDTY